MNILPAARPSRGLTCCATVQRAGATTGPSQKNERWRADVTKFMYSAGAVALLVSAGLAGPVQAAADTPPGASSVEEVIVTGTRTTGVKAIDSAAPIQVVGAGALTKVGQPDLVQALSQNLPSFNAEQYG